MGAVRLRVRLPSGMSTLTCETFGALKDHIQEQLVNAGSSEQNGWELLSGYPPAPLELKADEVPLTGFVQSGETLVVKGAAGGSGMRGPTATAPAAPVPDEPERMVATVCQCADCIAGRLRMQGCY